VRAEAHGFSRGRKAVGPDTQSTVLLPSDSEKAAFK